MLSMPGEKRIREIFETVSPISIEAGKLSVRLGVSQRFLLFRALSWITKRVEEDPHLNFLTILKSYKALQDSIDGTLHELHRDRNALYFKGFFIDEELWRLVKDDLEWAYPRCRARDVLVTVTKRGLIVYSNYKEDAFSTLLLTVHSGTWMRQDIQVKQTLTGAERLLEEDIDIHRIYGDLVLQKGGIWIDNKASRFACDYNRSPEKAIYSDRSEEWLDKLWKAPLTRKQREWLMEGYSEFYHTLKSIVKTHRFNIIFDAHSMKDAPGRTDVCIGAHYIPRFYLPIVHEMLQRVRAMGYSDAALDAPFVGGHILEWMARLFPDRFIFFMEVNKRLYMTKDRRRVIVKRREKLARDVLSVFNVDAAPATTPVRSARRRAR